MSRNRRLYGYIFICSALHTLLIAENLDDGCGHSVLGAESGVLSSRNYPGTYPNNSWCDRRIIVPTGKGILLKFGDLDMDCGSDYVKVLKGPYGTEEELFCKQKSRAALPTLQMDYSEVTVQFRSGTHISGRGFLLSYATVDHQDLLSCLVKGSHSSAPKYRKYCPAGCGGLAGDVSGDISQGYRHTSALCKAAVHAGVIQDGDGGSIMVEEHKGRSHYPATRANGVQSQYGSLSETYFTFVTSDCKRQFILKPVAINASSWWQMDGAEGPEVDWSPNRSQPQTVGGAWAPHSSDHQPWLQLDLGEKKRITGILTTGSSLQDYNYYVESYKIQHKERNRWRTYTHHNTSEDMIFEGNLDNVQQTRNTFHPVIVARHLRVLPQHWHQRIILRIELLGCPHVKAVTPEASPTKPKLEVDDITEPVPSQTDLVKLAIIIVPTVVSVVLLLLGVCVFALLFRKKPKENTYGTADTQQTGCWRQIKQPFARHQSTEFTISYSSEKDPIQKLDLVTSTMAAEYQQPLMIGTGTVSRKGSTFRPMDTDTKEDPADPATHYDYLNTANQYALPLTNQEPEYATPIIERHPFRKDGFLPDPSYSVPMQACQEKGAVPGKGPSFATAEGRIVVGGLTGGYQTPQVKRERKNHSEGVYDSPKVTKPALQNGGTIPEYQKPQVKPPSRQQEGYRTPRDCVRVGRAIPPRPDPEGSSSDGS